MGLWKDFWRIFAGFGRIFGSVSEDERWKEAGRASPLPSMSDIFHPQNHNIPPHQNIHPHHNSHSCHNINPLYDIHPCHIIIHHDNIQHHLKLCTDKIKTWHSSDFEKTQEQVSRPQKANALSKILCQFSHRKILHEYAENGVRTAWNGGGLLFSSLLAPTGALIVTVAYYIYIDPQATF